ncbi:MAG: hypothetical protein Q4G68_06010 [Planctomycetia bacterium]|nr:hypothetical protein [Planctomycetia bacterium]
MFTENTTSTFRAGAARVDITPTHLPAIINGEFIERLWDEVADPLSARALVLDDGTLKIAMAVIDTCMIPDDLADRIKDLICAQTGISTDHILISATHCHSAPSLIDTLGSGIDEHYLATFPQLVADAVAAANNNLQEAELGYAADADPENVFCRRFIMKPGTAWTENTAFTGSRGDIAQMNPFNKQDDIVCRTGTPDPTVSVLSIRKLDGTPLAIYACYSTHYAEIFKISADYFGVFANSIAKKIHAGPDFVAMIANGTSGDSNCIDFYHPERVYNHITVGESVAEAGYRAWQKIEYKRNVTLGMIEEKMTLAIRKPTEDQVCQAREYIEKTGNRKPINCEDVYAKETLLMNDLPDYRTFKLQAIRIDQLGIAAIPAEVYAVTGREIRDASPMKQTFTVSLANGENGYIPPEEAFSFGGYTTWRASSSCLEPKAERKIRLAVIRMLEFLSQ